MMTIRHAIAAFATFATLKRALLILALLSLTCSSHEAHADDVVTSAKNGCPLFHCTPEATGVMYQKPISSVKTSTSYSQFGSLGAQGCSGDGYHLACIFSTDTSTASGTIGIIKVFDLSVNGMTLNWASGSAQNSYEPDSDGTSPGEVPYMFANGDIAAGDNKFEVRYDSKGAVRADLNGGKIQLSSTASNFGLTPVADDYGVVSQADGTLTLIRFSTWEKLSTLKLTDPDTGKKVNLVSPSSGTKDMVYVVTTNGRAGGNKGFLFAVALSTNASGDPILTQQAYFPFLGASGASPVGITPETSGLDSEIVLLHTPGLTTESTPVNHLLALQLDGSKFSPLWSVDLSKALGVAPTVDSVNKLVYYQLGDQYLYAVNLQDGLNPSNGSHAPLQFDMLGFSGITGANRFKINGHMLATQVDNVFTLLISAAVNARNKNVTGEYVMAYQPLVNPSATLWTYRFNSETEQFTAAWSLAPSPTPNVFRPIVIAPYSGINLLHE